jgi:isoquinoline 1-oxidoreductase alpha subunit
MAYKIRVNGRTHEVDVDADTPLLWVLRDVLDLKGAKYGCGEGYCGACTVHLDGMAIRSCSRPISTVGEAQVTTIEAIGQTPLGAKVQQAWIDHDVVQCGYCQPGQIMTATALLKTHPHPTDAEIDAGMAGNICRCATYLRIRDAIKDAAGVLVRG